MNRMHLEPQYAIPAAPKRGTDACGLRADFSRDAGDSSD